MAAINDITVIIAGLQSDRGAANETVRRVNASSFPVRLGPDAPVYQMSAIVSGTDFRHNAKRLQALWDEAGFVEISDAPSLVPSGDSGLALPLAGRVSYAPGGNYATFDASFVFFGDFGALRGRLTGQSLQLANAFSQVGLTRLLLPTGSTNPSDAATGLVVDTPSALKFTSDWGGQDAGYVANEVQRGRVLFDLASGLYANQVKVRLSGAGGLVGAWRLDETGGTDGSNLVANPGFETYTTTPGAPNSWAVDAGAGANIAKETSIVDAGSNSVKMTQPGTPARQAIRQTLAGLVAEKSYFVSVRVKQNLVGARPLLRIKNTTDAFDFDTTPGMPGQPSYADAVTDWVTLSRVFQAGTGKTYNIQTGGEASTAGDIVYFDSVVVQEIQVKDATPFRNHGTIISTNAVGSVGGPLVAQPGQIGFGARFKGGTGNERIDFPNVTTGTDTMTLEVWAQIDTMPTADDQGLFLFGSTSNSMGISLSPTLIVFRVRPASGESFFNIAASTVGLGLWHQFVLVADREAGVMRSYVDGTLRDTRALQAADVIAGRTLHLGGSPGGGNTSTIGFFGSTDEPRIYGTPRTNEEVFARYQATVGGVRPSDDVPATDASYAGHSSSTALLAVDHRMGSVEFDPAAGLVRWVNATGSTRTASIAGFTRWSVYRWTPQLVEINLANDVQVEVHAHGLVRFKGLASKLTFVKTTPNQSEGGAFVRQLNSDSWFISSTQDWSITTNVLAAGTGQVFVFYDEAGNQQPIARTNLKDTRATLRLEGF